MSRTDESNGSENGLYSFTFQFSTRVFKNEFLKITPPPSITINPEANQCKGIRNLSPIVSCTIKNRSIYAQLVPLDNKEFFEMGQILQLQVSSITNPVSMEPTDSFEVYIATSISNDFYVN